MTSDSGVRSGDRHRTLAELQERAARAATALASVGVGKGDAVALLLRNDFPVFEATMGAGMLGAYAVPINWHSKADEVEFLLADSGATVLVAHADLLVGLGLELPAGVEVAVIETPPELAHSYGIDGDAGLVPPGRRNWDEWLADVEPWSGERQPAPPSMIYTSGTTGRPKGVRRTAMSSDPKALARVVSQVVGIGPDTRTLIPAPLYHSAPNATALFAAQLGGLVVLQPRFDPEGLLALIHEHCITTLHAVPTMFVRLLKLPESVRRRYDVSSLRHVVHTAAPCPPEAKRRMIEWWGPLIHEYYGSTETGAVTFCTSTEWLAHPGSVGRALDGAVVKILDPEGRPLPAGQVGEIYSRFAPIADFTYHQQDDRRRAIEVEGLLTSGDLGYLDEDGFLYLCDRKTDMVIVGGSNVYPAEVEAALLDMPGVRDCAVFGIPDDDLGEVVAAVVEPDTDVDLRSVAPDADAVKAFLRGRLAGFKVPRVVEFSNTLPREDSGKIFKRQLRESYWAGSGRQI